jgi:tRNA-specific 2-thiouridylase
VGQRRGIRVSGPAPRYVLRVVAEQDAIVVGEGDALLHSELRAVAATWIGQRPRAAFAGSVRIRHRHRAADATIEPADDAFRVRFVEPQRAIAPGQAAVVYDGERVVGGGFIAG